MKIVKMVYGSRLYRLNTPESDIDYKSIVVPELNDLLLGKASQSVCTSTGSNDTKNGADDEDNEIYSLHYFVQLALKGDTTALDMLHCTEPLVTSPEWEFLVDNRKMFYTKKLGAFVGYLKSQVTKYSIKGARLQDIQKAIKTLKSYAVSNKVIKLSDIWDELPEGEFLVKSIKDTKGGVQTFYEINNKFFQNTNEVNYVYERLQNMYDSYGKRAKKAEKNDAVDWKAVSHALRAGYQLKHLYTKGDYEYPLKETGFLLKVKNGELNFKTDVLPQLEYIFEDVKDLSETVDLPKKSDHKFWENWVLNVYREKLLK